jgi:hypothetical protein
VYLVGHDITGLTGAEAVELLLLAPEGTFEALDLEARNMVNVVERKRGEA